MDFINLSDADFDRLNDTADLWIKRYAVLDNLPLREFHDRMQNEILRDEYVVADVARSLRFYRPERE